MNFLKALALVHLLSASAVSMIPADQLWLFGETGPFEILSLFALVLAAVVLIWHAPLRPALFPILSLLLLAERELEEDVWKDDNLLKNIAIWLDDSVLDNQVVLYGLGLFLLTTFFFFTLPYLRNRPFFKAKDVQVLAFGAVCAFIGQLGEFIAKDILNDPSPGVIGFFLGIEEVSEAYFALSVLCACVLATVHSRTPKHSMDTTALPASRI
ncbi:hypothetical protein SAMN04488118_107108 [Epibacterium ulvae]|uniref:Uncharacterized protein n=1 Tax=Epibacterium ulvae TaxID=1156985 RepID=A0A1G5R1K8_9RHOB|nr:hypothetical protein [Epibacterium ulvae]SCZ67738.1 hypothetical protein SAMN04488118_107108 [Epibacterium ulvae]